VVGEVDFGWSGPSDQASLPVSMIGVQDAFGAQGVVGSAAEEQAVGVGAAVGVPRRVVVYLAVISGLGAATTGERASGPRAQPERRRDIEPSWHSGVPKVVGGVVMAPSSATFTVGAS
jgi:hypothetical protein